MLDPSNRTAGRGLLLFAALMLGLSLYLGATEGLRAARWLPAAFWLAIAVLMACYGALLLGLLARAPRLLLIVGLGAGLAAFWLALRLAAGG